MNARAPPVKMEAHALTMLTLTPVPADLGLLASTVKPTSLTALKGDGLKQPDLCILTTYRDGMSGNCQI